jgi:cytochrome c oxidase subunit I
MASLVFPGTGFYPRTIKDVGTLYLTFAMYAGLIGGTMLMRYRLVRPGGASFGADHQAYNVVTAHGLTMILFTLMPALIGGFGNWFVPLVIGAPNMASRPVLLIAMGSIFVAGGAGTGWTLYPQPSGPVGHTGAAVDLGGAGRRLSG